MLILDMDYYYKGPSCISVVLLKRKEFIAVKSSYDEVIAEVYTVSELIKVLQDLLDRRYV